FELPDGRGMRRAMAYMVPFIRDKKSWPLPPDVMYDGEWPMRQASLLFAGLALAEPSYLELWKTLPADSDVDEVIRNFFIRQPLLWADASAARADAQSVTIVSPNKKVRIDVSDPARGLRYRVSLEGRPVIEDSALGILVDGVNLGGAGARLAKTERHSTNETYPWRGVHAKAVDRSNGARVGIQRDGATVATLELRAFDDAAAFRFLVPGAGERVPDAG